MSAIFFLFFFVQFHFPRLFSPRQVGGLQLAVPRLYRSVIGILIRKHCRWSPSRRPCIRSMRVRGQFARLTALDQCSGCDVEPVCLCVRVHVRARAPVCMRTCPYWCFEMQSHWGHNLVHYVLWFAAVAPGPWHRTLCHLLPTGFLMRVCDLDASSLTTVSFPLFTSVFSILITLFIAFARRNLLYWRGGGRMERKKKKKEKAKDTGVLTNNKAA